MAVLGIGVIIAFNQTDDVHVFSKHNLKYLYNKISSLCVFSISFGIWSGPDALLFFELLIHLTTSAKEITSLRK